MTPSALACFIRAAPRFLRRHKPIEWLTRVFPRQRLATFTFNDSARIVADLADGAVRQALITGEFEPEFFAIAESFILPRSAVFDVGANHGFCTCGLAARSAPGSGVGYHLFEANPHLCETLRLAARLYPQTDMRIVAGCVADRHGTSRLQLAAHNWGASYISTDNQGVAVENIVLDDYVAAQGIPLVSFVKMDVEGYETYALRGLQRSLAQGKIGALYVECSSEMLRRQGATAEALLQLLRELGCHLFWCKPQDFASGLAKEAKAIAFAPGSAPLRLAPLRDFPEGHQTDVIAVPSQGPFGDAARMAAQ